MTLIDPRLLRDLTPRFFPSRVTVQVGTETNEDGSPSISWADVSGLGELPCRVSPIAKDERRSPPYTVKSETHVLIIPENRTEITSTHRVIVETEGDETLTLNVLAVEHDSEGQTTRIRGEIVTI